MYRTVQREVGAVSGSVRFESADGIAVITLDRPAARNAVDREVALALEAAVDRLEDDADVTVGILCANVEGQERPVFCAGADLKFIQATGDATGLDTERGGFAGFVFRERRKPVVVAVDGLATAGGLEIVLAADIVVASTRSSFGLAEVKRNLIAAAGGLYRLPQVIGRTAAMDAILTGEPITAERAFTLGLVSRLVDAADVMTEARAVATAIAAAAPLAVQASRQVVLQSGELGGVQLKEMSRARIAELLTTQDAAEGLAAFAEKRAPRWQGA